MNLLCILLFINLYKLLHSLHLNNYQIIVINKLVQNPLLQNKERNTINNILYNAYEKWAIKKAIDFKTLHKYKCSNIKSEELILSAKMGLFKSITKYNGKHSLINYSSIYVESELLKLLTDKYSLSGLPKKYRGKNKKALSKEELIKYNLLLNIQFSSQYEKWKSDLLFVNNDNILSKINKKNEERENVNKLMNNLTPFSKRILYLKYNYNSIYNSNNRTTTNKKIAELMCCSEENIRKELEKIKQMANI